MKTEENEEFKFFKRLFEDATDSEYVHGMYDHFKHASGFIDRLTQSCLKKSDYDKDILDQLNDTEINLMFAMQIAFSYGLNSGLQIAQNEVEKYIERL